MSAAKFTSALLTAPGPHPDADTLRRYAAGNLPPAEEQRIEAHTLDCERCDDLVAGFAMGTPASTDHAVAELRQRLQARLQQPELRPAVRPLWQPLAAAATVAGLLAGGIWGWQHRQPAAAPEVARTEVIAPAGAPPAPPVAVPPTETVIEAEKSAAANATPAPATEVAPAPVTPPAVASAGRAGRPAKPAARATSPATTAADADVAVVLAPVTSPAASEAMPDFALNDEAADKNEEAKDDKAVAAAAPGRMASMKAKSATTAPAAEGSVRRPEPMPPVPAMPAQPLGGMKTLKEYLRRAANEFEPEINTTHLSGIVHLTATVGEDGRLRNVKVTRGLRDDYDAEAERIVCDGPTWTPAVSAGRRVPSVVEIAVPF